MPGTKLNQYERIDANSTIRHRHIIPLPGGATGVIEFMDGQPQSTGDEYYLLSDLLGSSTVVLSRLGTSGGVTETYAYDAWGNPRDPDTWNTYGFQTAWPSYIGNRGYGGHDMLEDVSMVHMGGRIYDPVTSRFLSPDPYVQSPNNLQNYNRYTYVLNNPMSYTDPSGFLFNKIADWVGDVFSGIGDALGSMWKTIRPYVGTIVTVAFSVAGMPYVGALLGSTVATAANGGKLGDFLTGIGIGIVAGVVAGPIAGNISRQLGLAARDLGTSLIRGVLSGAVSGLTSAVVYGRDVWKSMRNGALIGGATSAVIHLYRAHQAETFLESHSDIEMGSDADNEFIRDAIRDLGQSPSGSRMLRSFIRSGETVQIRALMSAPEYLQQSVVGTVDWGPVGESPTNNVYFDMEHLPNQRSPVAVVAHEFGHTLSGGFTFVSEGPVR